MSELQGVHALIIEDDNVSVEVLAGLLEQVGANYTVITYDIEAQLQEVAVPDVVFIDLEIPEINGYDVLALLRGAADFDGVPMVAYTTHLSHMNDARNAGFDSFLAKPLDRRAFAGQLARILNGERVWEV